MLDCENKCVNEHRFKQIEEDLRELRDKNSRDHGKFYTRIENVEKDMIESQGDRKHIREQLDKINDNVESLVQKPARRYETVVTSILTAVIGALVGFVLSGVIPL